MFCTASNKHTDTKITRIKQKYSNDNQKARRKIIELQPQIFIYSFQVKLNKTTYLSFKHIICRFMTESDNVTDNLVFAVNSLITLYQIRRSGTSVIIRILWSKVSTFQFSFVLKHLISCQLFVHFLSVRTAMGERVQATYPRPGNLFYSFKNIIC